MRTPLPPWIRSMIVDKHRLRAEELPATGTSRFRAEKRLDAAHSMLFDVHDHEGGG